ncbi:MAG: sigma-70 family RNA polymerase sigma factor [Kiritimatiellae bacterium]|nr:sigma-70 family RNA polymerase sigma factor [Kiritimatiellia bacterium]
MTPPHETFIGLFATAQPALQRFVCAAIPDFHEAEDVLQKVAAVLWKKFGEYQEGTLFQVWAMRVAQYEILHARRSHARSLLIVNEALAERAAEHFSAFTLERDERMQQALAHCLEQLPSAQGRLVAQRYRDGMACKTIAEKLGRKPGEIRTQLCRIREKLRACIHSRLGASVAGGPS